MNEKAFDKTTETACSNTKVHIMRPETKKTINQARQNDGEGYSQGWINTPELY